MTSKHLNLHVTHGHIKAHEHRKAKRYFVFKTVSPPRATRAHRAALISFCSSQPDTGVCHENITDTELVQRMVCPFMPQFLLVLTVPTMKEQPGCVDLGDWLDTEIVCRSTDVTRTTTNRARRTVTLLIETNAPSLTQPAT